ncbi:MAG: protoporphyrinogen oxidase [Gemmatimonadota bacterium]
MIGIVGGGLSGLFLLHALRRRDMDAVLLEADHEVGGVARSVASGERMLDLGPQRFRASPELLRVLGEVGLSSELVPTAADLPLLIWRKGRLRAAPHSWLTGLTTDLLSWRGKLRVPLELLGGPPGDEETVADFLRRRLGEEAYLALAGPLLGGLYASQPERMLARHSLAPILRQGGENGRMARSLVQTLLRVSGGGQAGAYGLERGMGSLANALKTAHDSRVRVGCRVETLQPSVQGGYRLEGPWGTLRVEQVVLANPAPEASRLLEDLDVAAAAALARLRANPLAVIHLESGRDLRASGVKLALDEPGPVRGITANGSLLGRTGLYTAFMGGMGREEVLDAGDAELMATAEGEFFRLVGWKARALHLHRTSVPAWDATWAAVEGLRLPTGVHLCTAYHGRPGIPGRLDEAESLAQRLASIPRERAAAQELDGPQPAAGASASGSHRAGT